MKPQIQYRVLTAITCARVEDGSQAAMTSGAFVAADTQAKTTIGEDGGTATKFKQ